MPHLQEKSLIKNNQCMMSCVCFCALFCFLKNEEAYITFQQSSRNTFKYLGNLLIVNRLT